MNVRDQLLAAAGRVYAEAGYRGATTRRIASEAGVNEITLFRHFGSKDALIREAILRVGQGIALVHFPDHPQDPYEELVTWARAHIAGLRERRSMIRTCMGEIEEHPGIIPSEDSPPAKAGKALRAYLGRLRAHRLTTASFDEAAACTMLMGVLFADAMGRDIMPDLYNNDPDEALREYVRLFLRAIGVRVREPVTTS